MELTSISVEIDGRLYQGQVTIRNGIITARTDRAVRVVYAGDAASIAMARDLLMGMIETLLPQAVDQLPVTPET